MRVKAIIITGGEGFISANFIKLFLNKNRSLHIISIDSYLNNYPKKIYSPRVKYLKGETKNIEKILINLSKKYDINCLFHFGEFSRIVASFQYFNECLESNVIGTNKVIRFCVEKKIRII